VVAAVVKGREATAGSPLTTQAANRATLKSQTRRRRTERGKSPRSPAPARRVLRGRAGRVHSVSLLRSVPGHCRDLADQCSRAATSVGLNAAEGLGRAGRDRANHFRIAYGSALEATAALQMLSAVGAVPQDVAHNSLALLDRTRAMLWRLMHPRV